MTDNPCSYSPETTLGDGCVCLCGTGVRNVGWEAEESSPYNIGADVMVVRTLADCVEKPIPGIWTVDSS